MKKLHFCDFAMKYGVYSEQNITVDGVKGLLCKISEKLTSEQKEELLKYNNVKLFYSKCTYAPEIVHNAVFLGSKCFKVVEG